MDDAAGFFSEDAYSCFRQGYEKQLEGDIEEAIRLYQKSIEILPTAEAFTFLGWAYSFQGRFDEAIEECRKAIDIDPDYGNPYNDIGSYLIEKGKVDEAIPWLEQAARAKRYEAYFYPYYNLGRAWEQKGDWASALEHYNKALELNPGYTLAEKAVKRLQGIFN